jgi:hypothetical protein
MKKFAIGCLLLLVIGGIGAGIAGYYFVYRPARAYVASVAKLQVIPELNKEVNNKSAFVPPETGDLTNQQVGRFIAIQDAMLADLGPRIEELDQKYRTLSRLADEEGRRDASIGEALSALRDLAGIVVDAKRAQVAALNQHGSSLAEYEWVQQQVYRAAGVPMVGAFKQVIKDVSEGRAPDVEGMMNEPVRESSEKNRELIEPHLDKLRERIGLAFFGL